MRRPAIIAALLVGLVVAACGEPTAEPTTEAPLPPGNLLPEDVETMLFGSPTACREDADCPSQLCNYGACGGLVSVDARWLQERVGEVLVAHVEAHPALRERVVWHLARVLRRPRIEFALRARCVVGLELLGAWQPLEEALDDLPEPVAEAAATSLARLGRPKGLMHTAALTEADALPVAVEALRALGHSRLPDALPVLLSTLNPELDAELQRAALDGLAAHGDPRALGPLAAYLEIAPEHLTLRTVRTLRSLAGVELATDVATWKAHLSEHPPPPPPPYTLRRYRTEDDIGLPTP